MNQSSGANYPIASLYVGDLDPGVTEAMLFDKFSPTGLVLSIRVCRDLQTRRSLGYAYVNFQQPADAERALDTLNFDPIKGRPCRIMWSQRDPSLRKSGVGNIFIKNLDKNIDNKALYDTFSAFGNILSCKVETGEDGSSKGFGFVHFETQEAAGEAIKKVNGMFLNDKIVFVGRFQPKQERDEIIGDQPIKFKNVFVKNFGETMDEEKIKETFEKYGQITSHVIMRDGEGKSKGFGFVAFESPSAAEEAVNELSGLDIDGRKLTVCRAQKKAERVSELKNKYEKQKMERINHYQGVNLYIKNLDDTIDDDALRKEFEKYGTITSAKVMRDERGISRGFGFVCFSSPDEATKAVTDTNGHIMVSKPLYVALAQRKEDRAAQLAAQFMQRVSGYRTLPQGTAPQMYQPSNNFFVTNFTGAGQRSFMPQNPQMATPRWRSGPQMRNVNQFAPMGNQMQKVRPRQQFGRNVGNMGNMPRGNMMGMRQTNPMGMGAGHRQPQKIAAPRQTTPATAPMHMQATPAMPEQKKFDSSELAKAMPEERKQMIGERLFPLVQQHQEHYAGKITGMLLEIEDSDLLKILDSPDLLRTKVEEAVEVLKNHQDPSQPKK